MSAIENATFYKRAVETFGLPPERAEKIAAQMTALGVGRDDAYMLLFLATGKVEAVAETIPGEMRNAGAGIISDVQGAVSSELQKQLSSLPASMAEKLDGRMETFVRDLAANVDLAVNKEASRRQYFRLGGFALGVAALTVAALGSGYFIGRETVSSDAAKWSAVVDLPDGGKWLALARLNDIDAALAKSCSVGKRRVIAGGEVCDVPLAITAPVSSSQGVDFIRLSFAEWANKLGVWGLLGIGAVLGFLVGRFRKSGR